MREKARCERQLRVKKLCERERVSVGSERQSRGKKSCVRERSSRVFRVERNLREITFYRIFLLEHSL